MNKKITFIQLQTYHDEDREPHLLVTIQREGHKPIQYRADSESNIERLNRTLRWTVGVIPSILFQKHTISVIYSDGGNPLIPDSHPRME